MSMNTNNQANKPDNSSSNGHTILIIDDQASVLEVVSTYLVSNGYTTLTAQNGELGLKQAKCNYPDLILLDVRMPDIDGFETCRLLNADEETKDIPVIFMTGLVSEEDVVAGFAAGGVDYVTKPIRPDEFFARINTHLKLRRMQQLLEHDRDALKIEVKERTLDLELTSKSLRESERKFKDVFEFIQDGYILFDMEGIILLVNPATVQSLGYERYDELIGKDIKLDIYNGPNIQTILQGQAQDSVTGYELIFNRRDGRQIITECNIRLLRDEGGRAFAVEGLFRNVTERRQAEEALRETGQLLETIFNNTHMSVAYMDTQFNFVKVNRTYAQSDEREPSFFPGKNHFDLYPNPENEAIFRWVVKSGEAHFTVAKPFKYSKHLERGVSYWDWSLSPIKDLDGRVVALMLTLHNVTKRIWAEKDLEEYRQDLEKLVAERTGDLLTVNHALQMSETRYRAIVEEQTEFIIRWLPDGTRTFVNESYCRFSNRSYEELVGGTFLDWLPETDVARVLQQVKLLTPDNPVLAATYYGAVAPDEYPYWTQWIDRGVFDKKGNLIEIQSVGRDITPLKLAERELRLLKTAVEASTTVIVITDIDGNITWANPAASHITGYTLDELLEQNPRLFQSGEHDREFYKEMWDMILSGQTWRGEIINKRKNGSLYTEGVTITPVQDEAGKISHFIAVKQDITQRKQVENDLRASEEALHATLASVDDLVFTLDRDGIFLDYHQPPQTDALYVSPEQFLGRPYRDVYPPYLTVLYDAAIDELTKIGDVQQIDYLLEISGQEEWFSSRLSMRRDRQGEFDGVTVVAHNISERKQKELALQKAHDRLTTLLTLSRNIASTLDLDTLLNLALQELKKVMEYKTAFIVMYEGDDMVIAIFLSDNDSAVDPTYLHIPFSEISPMFRDIFMGYDQFYIADMHKFPDIIQSIGEYAQRSVESLWGEISTWLMSPLVVKEQVIGTLNLVHNEPDKYNEADKSLIQIFSNQLAIAIENVRLYEQAQETAILRERNRLARELHDSVTQSLYSISLFTDASRLALNTGKINVVNNHLSSIYRMSREAMGDMRLLIFELRPPILEEMGLAIALQTRLASVEKRAGIQVDFQVAYERRLSTAVEGELYWAAQEGLTNIMRHAQASQIIVCLGWKNGRCRLTIEDNGIGFDLDSIRQGSGHDGLYNMQERIKKIHGTMDIDTIQGKGTTLTMEV